MLNISIKNDFVLSHIEALDVGTKISVRGLATELDVSEGTVYKAIKEAELRGYVITKPKSGTIRLDKSVNQKETALTLTEIVAALGISCVGGKKYLDNAIEQIVICDGSVDQLTAQLRDCEPQKTLCIVSDRPDMLTLIVQTGANILLTGGTRPTDYHIVKAEKAGVCVLSALQSTYTIAKLLSSQFHNRAAFGGDDAVSEWMQLPNYLYHNDIVADWQRFYHDSFAGMKYYPIVDEELKLYGELNVAQTFVASHYQKLSTLSGDDTHLLTVDSEETVRDVAQKMLNKGSSCAVVTQNGKMAGIIYPLDILRYFASSQAEGLESAGTSFTFIPELSTEDRKVYEITGKNADAHSASLLAANIALRASASHLSSSGHPECSLESCYFSNLSEIREFEGLLMSTTLNTSGKYHYSVEVEVYTDRESYLKGILTFSETDRR